MSELSAGNLNHRVIERMGFEVHYSDLNNVYMLDL